MDEPAIRAAGVVIAARKTAQRPRRATTTPTKPISIRAAAAMYGISPAAVQRAIARLSTPETPRVIGRPPIFSDDEDEAIAAYIVWMQQGGFPATKLQVEAAAMTLRWRRDPNAPALSRMWYRRWIEARPFLRKTTVKVVERDRKSFESADIANVEKFFSRLKELTEKHRIGASEIWNEDECGIRIGSVRERISVVVVRTTRHRRPEVIDPGNRESCTLIGAANAAGDVMPPWMVFKVFPSESWANVDGSGDIRFARSDTGFSNREITLDWIRHFNIVSWTKSSRAQATSQSLEQWFGCSVDCSDPNSLTLVKREPRERPKHERIFRLLIIDGFTGHTDLDFIEYCIKFDIFVVLFPPHSTHILQPLDVGVFQPLKNAQQKDLREFLLHGNLNFTRHDFLASLQQTFDEGFTRCNIISGFKKTGIWPTRSEPAVAKLLESQKKARRPVDPAYASLLPAQDRWQQSANVVRDVNERYHEVLSSPSRRGMARASQVMVEAQLLESNLRHSIQERDRRIEKVNNRLKRGKAVKPSGQFFANSVSLDQIRQQAQKTTEAEAKKEEKRQLRESQRILRREMETLRQQWRDDKVHEIDGKRKTLNFKQWLDLTKKADNYISLECNNKEYLQLLNMRDESFFVDAERRGQRPGLDEAIRKASQAAKPLTAFEFPPSDLSIEIFTQRPLEDNPGDDEDEFSSMHDPDEHHEHHDAIQYDGPAPASCKAHTHN
ncbi:hypothetical protein HIM_10909 [Hirsutella minnesotensis 3608]|uniref:DDE-1 domain-containing protein n=1 Tax=Hirsutella minnesotensis 3608 TaxID=1043627 RepID=A0A0F7ZFM1_9HYPO|nr:hypothetical protein HIM_12124 [Hirsutella minnesotensis 3608]KJZ69381.1 hypothetical protein HIM_11220 [Hirsutella minnesotensis 3608]KJZ69688.1 hypothetical protein HIM_10909 [Hirsutella minnesotensis 3608]